MTKKDNRFFTEEKKDLLFLHGYLSSNKEFVYQYGFFERYFNIYSPDLKGFGENKDMQYPYSLSDYCDEVIKYVINNGLKSPCVIAHSFGGRIAVKIASEDPEFFSKMVLTGSAGLKPKFSFKKFYKKTVYKILKRFCDRQKLSGFFSSDYNALSPVMKESFIKIVNEYNDERLSSVKNETLIINGEKDAETPVYTAKRFHKKIKNSRLIIMKGAGHFCFIDDPYTFNTEVREFLLS